MDDTNASHGLPSSFIPLTTAGRVKPKEKEVVKERENGKKREDWVEKEDKEDKMKTSRGGFKLKGGKEEEEAFMEELREEERLEKSKKRRGRSERVRTEVFIPNTISVDRLAVVLGVRMRESILSFRSLTTRSKKT